MLLILTDMMRYKLQPASLLKLSTVVHDEQVKLFILIILIMDSSIILFFWDDCTVVSSELKE